MSYLYALTSAEYMPEYYSKNNPNHIGGFSCVYTYNNKNMVGTITFYEDGNDGSVVAIDYIYY